MSAPADAGRPDVVRVENFTRRFADGAPVLDRLELRIAGGEFVSLLGRSGSGKTTLLRALAGLDPVEEGAVHTPDHVAVVFQESRLLPWKTVWQNVALGLPEHGAAARERAVAALEEVGLGHRLDAWPLTLSGGEAQRAGIARALVREPELLMLDEPFASLDALTRLRMQAMVAELWRKRGCAVLLVTHDVDEAIVLGDRAVVLDRGRLRVELPVVLDRPRRHDDPGFNRLRRDLLGALDVRELA
ncbi:MAG: ABC transporter ATP-binding protein [Gluconacetobacter diazotrophicus]|nr:ABC transporter ATP-binding protein [Gluconacetobacter diazotrophicus]